MTVVLEEVLESSLTLVDNLSKANVESDRYKIITEYLNAGGYEVNVGDFKEGLEWFNVTSPLSLEKDLKGKLVILDFFTYCCINCLHILPKLKSIEKAHSIEKGVVVIGVHSAKFDNEKDSANILAALQRYKITHPVVNDADGTMWSALGIPCWPTLLVLSPMGKPIFVAVGESNVHDVELFVREAVFFYDDKSTLSNHTLSVRADAHVSSRGPLLFPGKVACFENENTSLLAIADTGHHRILICSSLGEVKFVIGGTVSGFYDGEFNEAKFTSPQGLAFVGADTLYVADTENDAIRKIDMKTKKVTTVISNNEQISGRNFSSPWDVCALPDESCLLIAAAGCHQIWALFLKDKLWWRNTTIEAGTRIPIAGTGREENRNNVYPHAAAFAQPSGICVAESLNAVFIADSESSSIRRLDLKDGRVSAVVGGGRSPTDLFCFGDVDGLQWDVRLQHPLGVAWSSKDGGALYIVDSYNHKLKMVLPEKRSCQKVFGSGVAGDCTVSGSEELSEPGGLCISSCGTYVYIADTNNCCIKRVHLCPTEDPPYCVSKLDVKLKISESDNNISIIEESTVKINPAGGSILWKVTLVTAKGLEFTAGVPQRWTLKLPGDPEVLAEAIAGNLIDGAIDIDLKIPPKDSIHRFVVTLVANAYLCDDDTSSCSRHKVSLALNVEYHEDSQIKQICSMTGCIAAQKKVQVENGSNNVGAIEVVLPTT